MEQMVLPFLWWPYLVSLLALLLFLEQLSYLRKKSSIPGPPLVVPFIGSTVPLVKNPAKYWSDLAERAKLSPDQIAADYILGNFTVFVRDSEVSHRVFANVRPDAFQVVGHPFGKKLFGDHNLIFMFGQHHKDVRRRLAPNFSPRALSSYLSLQQRLFRRHFLCWAQSSSSVALRLLCRDLNLDVSQTVFVGPYLTPAECDAFNRDYALFNAGLLALPIDLPGTSFRAARLAVDRLVLALSACTARSKARMLAGLEPACLIDFWMEGVVKEIDAAGPPHSSDAEIGGYLFDFLFAAQDASTSSLLWAVTLLEAHPAVVARVREEVAGLWSPESGEAIGFEQLREMRYVQAVAREVLRIRPPATLVPHVALADFRLTDTYTVPKGAIVFPSLYESSFQGFTDPARFDPDRFYSPDRQEDELYKRNFLVFGAGPHQCVGQRYALNHLTLFIAMFTAMMDFKRDRTDGCDDLAFVPTIAPKDDCRVHISLRCAPGPTISS